MNVQPLDVDNLCSVNDAVVVRLESQKHSKYLIVVNSTRLKTLNKISFILSLLKAWEQYKILLIDFLASFLLKHQE